MTHYHLISGGAASWLAARLDRQANPSEQHKFVFTDTLYEDADGYRFLIEGMANIIGRQLPWAKIPQADDFPDYKMPGDFALEEYRGNPEWRAFLAQLREDVMWAYPEMIWLVEGRDPWEVFRDERFLGNSRIDPCSKILKRKTLDKWRNEHCDPKTDVFTLGIGTDEKHRYDDGDGGGMGPRMAEKGWRYTAPLIGTMENEIGAFVYLHKAGIQKPRLYRLGYIHNNCGGFCIKAGKEHYRNRNRVQNDRFAYDSMFEQKFRAWLGGDIAMMTDSITQEDGSVLKSPLTLAAFSKRILARPEFEFEYAGDSGCGCMLEDAA